MGNFTIRAMAAFKSIGKWPYWGSIYISATLAAILFLSFVVGAASMYFKFFPYKNLNDAFAGSTAVIAQATQPADRYARAWSRSRKNRIGIMRHDPERAYQGYTLFTSAHGTKALLMDMEGNFVHEWGVPYSSIWDDAADVKNPVPDDFIRWRKAHLFPNGDLLVVFIGQGTPWGYGLAKIDKDSNVLWKYMGRMHHDVEVGPDGKIYALSHRILKEKQPWVDNFKMPVMEESIVILSPDGKELQKFSVLKAVGESDLKRLLFLALPQVWNGDLLHTNAIDYVDAEIASRFPFAKEGQLLVSFRNISTIALIDPKLEKVVWAERGAWYMQHDPDFLENGNILLFDNRGNFNSRQKTRILEFNPTTMEIVWRYEGTKKDPFISHASSSQQRLPNGNTLITETYAGRLFEVARDGTIVWEYFSPFRSADDKLVAAIYWGQRFSAQELAFPFNKTPQQ